MNFIDYEYLKISSFNYEMDLSLPMLVKKAAAFVRKYPNLDCIFVIINADYEYAMFSSENITDEKEAEKWLIEKLKDKSNS
jgi:hypothetical protein